MSTANPIDWKSVDGAIVSWLGDQLGVPAIPEKRNRPQPVRPYVSFKRNTLVSIHKDAKTKVLNPDNPQGEEIERTLSGHREFTLTVQAYSDDVAPNSDTTSMMSIVLASLSFPKVRKLFRGVNVAIIAPLNVIDLSSVTGGNWVSRAALDVRCRTLSTILADKIGYIGQVTLGMNLQGGVNGPIEKTIIAPVGQE